MDNNNREQNPPVPAETIKHQNSVAVLSLWHCILSWFYMNCEQKHCKDQGVRDTMEVLEDVYNHMRDIRETIQTDGTGTVNVESIVEDFQILVNKIDKDRWKSVIKSMMHGLMEMLRVLKENKEEFIKKWEMGDKKHVTNMKLKQFSCLLTLWYWLAVWSDSDHSEHSDELTKAKVEYCRYVELNKSLLNKVFFTSSHDIPEENTDEKFQTMISNLVALLRTDPQHWISVLDHFINRMVHAGCLRAQVRNVWAEVDRLKSTSNATSSSEIAETGAAQPSPSEPLLVHGLGLLLKTLVSRTPLTAIADKIPNAVSYVYNDIKKENYKDIAEHIPNVVGEIAGPEAKQIAAAVVHESEVVGEHVVDGVKEIGHVLGEGVHEFSKGVNTVFHSVKNFFSNLF